MLQKYFIAFVRNIRKDKAYSIINLLGFTVGIASFLLILLFVSHELSYDKYHANSDRVYRLGIKAMVGETRINQTFSSSRIFREMSERFPEIKMGTKFINWDNGTVKYGDRIYTEQNIMMADSTIFDLFTMPLIYGAEEHALNRPNTMVISETCSRKYFGKENPVGEVLRFDLEYVGELDFEISGVYEDIPINSHNHYDMLGSMVSFPDLINSDGWSNNNFITYFLLHPDTDVEGLVEKMQSYAKESIGLDRYEEWASQGNFWEFFLQPLPDIHLKSDLNGEFEANGDIRNVYIFSVIAFFVLIIACINFMNLATARSARRAREVGIRKVSGSSKGLLITQFLIESVLLTLTSVLLALVLVLLTLPWFNDWLGLQLSFDLIGKGWLLLYVVSGGISIGLLSGLYPALFLSSYKPIRVLKSQSVPSRGGFGLRNALVTFQFAASIFLIIGTLMVSKQMHFLKKTDLGFVKDNVLVITGQPAFEDHYESFRQELISNSSISNVTAARTLPGYSFSNIGFRSEYVEQSFTLNIYVSDEYFVDVLGLRMAEGRFFSNDFLSDTSGVILNETAVRVLGLDDPLGKTISSNSQTAVIYPIIGVVEDFHYESMHSEIRPMAMFHREGPFTRPLSYIAINYEQGKEAAVTKTAEDLWNKLLPGTPFNYTFLDNDYDGLYQNERQTSQVFGFLALLAIVVACLGLLGLAAYLTQQKTRQIAVRKVFGASARQIVELLTYRFVRWVFLAILIACPLGWWLMNSWLHNFVYKANIAWWIFAVAGLAALVIALVTISSVTVKAARLNPSESLKYE